MNDLKGGYRVVSPSDPAGPRTATVEALRRQTAGRRSTEAGIPGDAVSTRSTCTGTPAADGDRRARMRAGATGDATRTPSTWTKRTTSGST